MGLGARNSARLVTLSLRTQTNLKHAGGRQANPAQRRLRKAPTLGLPAPPLSLQALPSGLTVLGLREATPSSSVRSLGTASASATKATWQAASCGQRWSSASKPWPSARRSWSTRRWGAPAGTTPGGGGLCCSFYGTKALSLDVPGVMCRRNFRSKAFPGIQSTKGTWKHHQGPVHFGRWCYCEKTCFLLGVIFFFFWPRHVGCGTLVLHQGSNPWPLQWKRGGLTTGPPGNSEWFFMLRTSTTYWELAHLKLARDVWSVCQLYAYVSCQAVNPSLQWLQQVHTGRQG